MEMLLKDQTSSTTAQAKRSLTNETAHSSFSSLSTSGAYIIKQCILEIEKPKIVTHFRTV